MSDATTSVTCPHCGANVQHSHQSNLVRCSFCGREFTVSSDLPLAMQNPAPHLASEKRVIPIVVVVLLAGVGLFIVLMVLGGALFFFNLGVGR
jgi:ribosomal protein S27E